MCVQKLWSLRFEIQNLTLKIMLKMVMDDHCDWALSKLFLLHFCLKTENFSISLHILQVIIQIEGTLMKSKVNMLLTHCAI